MRTTVTLDSDVEQLLKNEAHLRGKSFKVVLNEAIRHSLRPQANAKNRKPFVVRSQPMGLRPGLDPARLSEVADDLEVEAFLAATKRLQKRKS